MDSKSRAEPRETYLDARPLHSSNTSQTISVAEGIATVSIDGEIGSYQRYVLETSVTNLAHPIVSPRTISEKQGYSRTRTNNPLFDGLYALALLETEENSKQEIRNNEFRNGDPIKAPDGGYFETGEAWTYIWTRDIAYAVDLGLALVDPIRCRNSLEFKTSNLRNGNNRQIVQDTGTGGSYPISTDRVSWALGAKTLLAQLTGQDRIEFEKFVFEVLANTIEHDRKMVFDDKTQLYRGEQSFLDWREQSYPRWVKHDVIHIGTSLSLSTNILHLAAIEFATDLATKSNQTELADKWLSWSQALRRRIQTSFRLTNQPSLSTFWPTQTDPSPAQHIDALSNAFAILFDVVPKQKAHEIISGYPVLDAGPPVIWPQQQATPVYHNRAVWPFVSAYWLLAAKKAAHTKAVSHGICSFIELTSSHLSNMENYEMETSRVHLDDGLWSGPVVNSTRQLWSVAGYLSMVHEVIFGLDFHEAGLKLDPYIPLEIRQNLFRDSQQITLNSLRYKDKILTIVLKWPNAAHNDKTESGYYITNKIWVDGLQQNPEQYLVFHSNQTQSLIEVELKYQTDTKHSKLNYIASNTAREYIFAPKTPAIDLAYHNDNLEIIVDANGESPDKIRFNIYRDGKSVATGLPGSIHAWVDLTGREKAHYYTLESYYLSSGIRSHRSKPMYWPGADKSHHCIYIKGKQFETNGGVLQYDEALSFYQGWGERQHYLRCSFKAEYTGYHLVQSIFSNGAGPTNTGITCAIKHLSIFQEETETPNTEGYLLFPHTHDWHLWQISNGIKVYLQKNETYIIEIKENENTINMSDFEHFTSYTQGIGGHLGRFNRVNIAEIQILPTPMEF